MAIGTFRDVVELWGTRESMAAELGVDSRKVSKWWQRDRIPADWWQAVLSSSIAREAGVSAEILAGLAARSPAPEDASV